MPAEVQHISQGKEINLPDKLVIVSLSNDMKKTYQTGICKFLPYLISFVSPYAQF